MTSNLEGWNLEGWRNHVFEALYENIPLWLAAAERKVKLTPRWISRYVMEFMLNVDKRSKLDFAQHDALVNWELLRIQRAEEFVNKNLRHYWIKNPVKISKK